MTAGDTGDEKQVWRGTFTRTNCQGLDGITTAYIDTYMSRGEGDKHKSINRPPAGHGNRPRLRSHVGHTHIGS
jgi:hypothetical protein